MHRQESQPFLQGTSVYKELSHNNINMCLCFSRRRKPRAPPSILPPLDSTLHPSYSPRPIYVSPSPTDSLPKTFTTTITHHSYQPTFPLSHKPSCRHCHCTPEYRSTVGFTNGNGNGGRHYYVCTECKTNPRLASSRNSKGWITWDDDKGVEPGNPLCDCGFISRHDRTGVNSSTPGREFWACSTGACGYFSWQADEYTD